MCQFAFMDEMHTPEDFTKSIWFLGIIEIVIYTVTGALIFAFVGRDVQAPALLSAGDAVSRIAFGVALPVIFISGSINTTVLGRMIHGRIYRNSPIRFINSPMGWTTWIIIIAIITVIAFIIAEVIPFFSDLLSICSSLFVSGFTFYFPPLFWFFLLKEGPWNTKNIIYGIANVCCVIIGLITLGAGTYSAIDDILENYRNGTVSGVFSCSRTSGPTDHMETHAAATNATLSVLLMVATVAFTTAATFGDSVHPNQDPTTEKAIRTHELSASGFLAQFTDCGVRETTSPISGPVRKRERTIVCILCSTKLSMDCMDLPNWMNMGWQTSPECMPVGMSYRFAQEGKNIPFCHSEDTRTQIDEGKPLTPVNGARAKR
ncbi:hypothetical protein KEM54_001155 [Ascosphaera aggregata]|nr:hypothetical protein KEM54_001155 [Ascosphaera aggregata]